MTKDRFRWAPLAVAVAAAAGAVPATAAAAGPKPAKPAPPAQVAATKAKIPVGGALGVSARARNHADRVVRIRIGFHLSRDGRRSRGDVNLGSTRTGALKPGDSAAVARKLRVPLRTTPGRWKLVACTTTKLNGPRACAVAAKTVLVYKPAARRPVDPPFELPRRLPIDQPRPPIDEPRPPVDPPRDPAPALAVQLDDGVNWGYDDVIDRDGTFDSDSVVTTKVRIGAGLPGQAGYRRASVPAVPTPTGRETVLADSAYFAVHGEEPNDEDDGSVVARLPFAFPFAGVQTRELSVSTNGWIGVNSGPATAHSLRRWEGDFRGRDEAMGALAALIAPYWGDLWISSDPADGDAITLVEPADGESVVIRWNVHAGGSDTPIEFSAVLFRDGRIRFDYDAAPLPDAGETTIGISQGRIGALADLVVETPSALPSDSVAFTPEAVVSGPAAAGIVMVELPRGTTFAGASDGCEEAQAPTPLRSGVVTCDAPAVAARSGAELEVRWNMFGAAWQLLGLDSEHAALWGVGDDAVFAAAEISGAPYLSAEHNQLSTDVQWPSGRPWISVTQGADADHPEAEFDVRMHRPTLTVEVPPGVSVLGASWGYIPPNGEPDVDARTLAAICIGLPVPPEGGTVRCTLPSGFPTTREIGIALEVPDPLASYGLNVGVSADNLADPLYRYVSVNQPG